MWVLGSDLHKSFSPSSRHNTGPSTFSHPSPSNFPCLPSPTPVDLYLFLQVNKFFCLHPCTSRHFTSWDTGKVGLSGVSVSLGYHLCSCSGVPAVFSGYSFCFPSPYRIRLCSKLETGEMFLDAVSAVPATLLPLPASPGSCLDSHIFSLCEPGGVSGGKTYK